MPSQARKESENFRFESKMKRKLTSPDQDSLYVGIIIHAGLDSQGVRVRLLGK